LCKKHLPSVYFPHFHKFFSTTQKVISKNTKFTLRALQKKLLRPVFRENAENNDYLLAKHKPNTMDRQAKTFKGVIIYFLILALILNVILISKSAEISSNFTPVLLGVLVLNIIMAIGSILSLL